MSEDWKEEMTDEEFRYACYMSMPSIHRKINDLISTDVFTEEMFSELESYLEEDPTYWEKIFLRDNISVSAMEMILRKDVLDLHTSKLNYFTIYAMYGGSRESHGNICTVPVEDRIRIMTLFLEKGADINEQCAEDNSSLLVQYIKSIIEESDIYCGEAGDMIARQSLLDVYHILPFLLQNGADPLLASKSGVTAMTLVRPDVDAFPYLSDETWQFIQDELAKYA